MNFARRRSKTQPFAVQGGFTLVELIIGLGVILIVGASAIACMIQLNRQAQIHRLYSCAATAAQNQIQLCLTDAPFIPQGYVTATGTNTTEVPSELAPGTTNTVITLTSDPVVTGTLTSVVTYPVSTGNSSLYVAQIHVNLTYIYRNNTYSVVANSLRASDL